MRTLFPGFFTPTDAEFKELWRDATFAFDANVLLGLYKLSSDTRRLFFDVLAKLGDRIFLPNQAACEYLKNRPAAISARTKLYNEIRNAAEKSANSIRSQLKEHSLPRGAEIVQAATEAAEKITAAVDAALKEEADIWSQDDLMTKIIETFDGKVGSLYDSSRIEEIYKIGAVRYARSIPPGYKDENKGEPNKYGDVVIWFQLVDQATKAKKPVIFVTRDAKGDWWLQHDGKTIGPRPELRQEMKIDAGVDFYMYTTTTFLEFAQEFFGLEPEPTKRATNEIEEIEKKEGQIRVLTFDPDWSQGNWVQPSLGLSPFVTGLDTASPFAFGIGRPARGVLGTYGLFTAGPTFLATDEMVSVNDYLGLLPINGRSFVSTSGTWRCFVESLPAPIGTDRACYRLKFEHEDRSKSPRHLALWVSDAGLKNDMDSKYRNAIFQVVSVWLSTDQEAGELEYFG